MPNQSLLARRNLSSVVALFFITTLITVSSAPADAAAKLCADVFKKEAFLTPSVKFTQTGRLDIKLTNSTSKVGEVLNAVARSFYKPLALDNIQGVTERYRANSSHDPYWVKIAEAFELDVKFDPAAIGNIPRTGGLLIVANHPHHGIDGIAIAAMISKVRPDIKIVLTPLLDVVPDISSGAVFMSPYSGKKAALVNIAAKNEMIEGLKAGQAYLIFPAAGVSGKSNFSDKQATDAVWKRGVADFIREVPTTQVLPIFVEGQTGKFYQNARLAADRIPKKYKSLCDIGDGVCAALHVREIGKRVNSRVDFVIGQPVLGADLNQQYARDTAALMSHLRDVTYKLHKTDGPHRSLNGLDPDVFKAKEKTPEVRVPEEIAPQGDMKAIFAELDSKARVIYDMAPDSPLKRMKVYLAKGADIPLAMQEVGRLREITFREVHEGSGLARDLDAYDAYYYQLIVVDKKTGDIAGGYRLGAIDEILANQGYDGIYSAQFFDHSKLVAGYLKYALELGRSYVVPEYQRSMALLALFNGIGRFIVENPRYRYLMGPVSISNDFTDRSKGTILSYLFKYHESPDAADVRPLSPLEKMYDITAEDQAFVDSQPDFRTLSKYVDDLEKSAATGMSMPQLFGIYTNLGADFFRFNVDRKFNSLDGFIATDLVGLPFDNLKNYMGEEGAQDYRQHWAAEIERLRAEEVKKALGEAGF